MDDDTVSISSSLVLAQQTLMRGIESIVDGGQWEAFLRHLERFPQYSSRNALLLYQQARERGFVPTKVAGYRLWKSLGRHVRRGEKGLAIVVPIRDRGGSNAGEADSSAPADVLKGFRVSYVFDVCQTDGAPLSEPLTPELLAGSGLPEVTSFLTSQLGERGFAVSTAPLVGMNGLTDIAGRRVEIARGLEERQTLKTLCHEYGHVLMHREGVLDRSVAEVEAETFAFLVLGLLGIDSGAYSFPYIARWADGDRTKVLALLDRPSTLANEVVRAFCGSGACGSGFDSSQISN
ncbi:MAG: ArdC-like ssDNA-binding domain-containing protein [Acidimicrobiales bacterium]